MYIKRMYYPVTTLGPGNRLGIWVTGCEKRCKGCISPDLWDFESGSDLPVDHIIKSIEAISETIDGITISGGEPFLQPRDLSRLVEHLSKHISPDIMIFTGMTLQELKARNDSWTDNVLKTISVLIDGEYIDSKNDGIGLRGSSNQRIHVFNNIKHYNELEQMERSLQSVRYKDRILVIGIQ